MSIKPVSSTPPQPHPSPSRRLSSAQKHQVDTLKAHDHYVRLHAQTPISANGKQMAGDVTLTYRIGPDGKLYAVAEEVVFNAERAQAPKHSVEGHDPQALLTGRGASIDTYA